MSPLWVGWLTLVTVLFAFAPRPVNAEASRGSYESYAWESPVGEIVARAIVFTNRGAEGAMNSRLLVETPDRRRIVVMEEIHPSRGKTVLRLLDDDTRWWIELGIDWGFRATSLKDYFNRAYDTLGAPGATLGLRLRTSDGSEWEEEVPIEAGQIGGTLEAFVERLAPDAAESLAQEMSVDLVDSLRFIDRAFPVGRPGESFRTMGDALSPLFSAIPSHPQDDSLTRTDGSRRRGSTPSEAELVALMDRFESLGSKD